MTRNILRALRATVVLLLITGVIYPLAMTGIAQLTFKSKAEGSLLTDGCHGHNPTPGVINCKRHIVGSKLIGQFWSGPKWFYGRPSAITTTDAKGNTVADPYDATTSSGSNLGPLSQDLANAIQQRARDIINIEANYHPGLNIAQIPADLLLASASGLDPGISVAAAEFQVPRIAAIRNRSTSAIEALVRAHIQGPPANFFGSKFVNVLELNLALSGS